MKTAVFQSYRTTNVPHWITACIASVRSWAASNGFDHRLIDDSFLDLAPAWFRDRCAGEICPVTDLARLVFARDLLAAGYERAVWVDADMLVFDAPALGIDGVPGFAFCLEVWTSLDEEGRLRCEQRVNNSISVFTRANRQLDFLIDACLRIAQAQRKVGKLTVSTDFLTGLGKILPIPLLDNVGVFSPVIVSDIAGSEHLLGEYGRHLPAPLAAANLCHSLVSDDAQCAAAVDKCMRTRGDVVNRHVRAAFQAAPMLGTREPAG